MSTTNEDSQTTTYGYGKAADGTNNGEVESVRSPLTDTVTMTYDPAGRMDSTTEARGNTAGASDATKKAYTSKTGYDAAGNVTSRTSAGNTSEPPMTTSSTYDKNNNKITATDANGNTTTYTYDKLNRLEKVTGPDGGITLYGYDSVGNLDTRTVKNVISGVGRDQVTVYGYNADRQLSSVTTPLGDKFTYTYTDAGNLFRTVDAEGNATAADTTDGITTYTYTTQNQLKRITYADGTPTVSYTYWPSGDRKTMTDRAGTESYEYWPNTSRLKTVLRDGVVTFSYAYTDGGSVKTRTAQPGNLTTAYTYDGNGLMDTVTAAGAVTDYDYYPGGRLKLTKLPNGYVETRDYKLNGRLDYVSNAKSGVVLSKASYTYDNVGNPTRVVTEDEIVDYTYNKRDMLTLACYGGNPCDTSGATTDSYYKYSYDRAGNRITKGHSFGGTNENYTYTYNADDEITVKDGPSGICNYEHDRNGNMTNQCGLRFNYNDANQMTSATKDGGTSVQTYTYDGDSKRLTTGNATAVTTRYQWDTNNELPSSPPSGAPATACSAATCRASTPSA